VKTVFINTKQGCLVKKKIVFYRYIKDNFFSLLFFTGS